MKSKILLICMIFTWTFVACQQEDQELELDLVQEKDINHLDFDFREIETKVNREFQVFDRSGKYSITLNIGSDEEQAIDEYLRIANFELNMTYFEDESPEYPESDRLSDYTENSDAFTLSYHVTKLNLDPKANGFYLDVTYNEITPHNARVFSYSYTDTYDSPDRWMYWGWVLYTTTQNSNPDSHVAWYYRNCQFCSMTLDWSTIISSSYPSSIYNREGARRIRAVVSSNWRNYRVFFRKWGNDPWRETPVPAPSS